jgi:hypothetical protein
MRARYRRDLRDDRGSIILALLGILILTTVASVGLSAIVNGQHQTRRDNAFVQALNNAESGIDAMVATIKSSDVLNSPSKALSQTPHLKTASYATNGYDVTATPANNIGQTGNADSTTWFITAVGTATTQGHTLTRTVTQKVSIAHTYNTPIEGLNGLSMPPGSSITNYQTKTDPLTGASPTTLTPTTIQGPTVSLLGLPVVTLGNMTITNVPSGGSPGAAQTSGPLSMSASDLSNFAQVAVDQGGTCNASADVCNSTIVVNQSTPAPPIVASGCESYNAIGASVNGLPLNLPPVGGLVLTDAVQAQLFPPAVNQQTICTNLPIVVPTVGVDLTTLTGQLGLSGLSNLAGVSGKVDFPINSSCTDLNTGHIIDNLVNYVQTDSVSCSMNDPSTLTFNELPVCNNATPPVCTANTIYLGTGGSVPTFVSAVIASPAGDCHINGNVIVWGTIACNTISYSPGSKLTVYYPTDTGLKAANTTHVDTVSDWNEKH